MFAEGMTEAGNWGLKNLRSNLYSLRPHPLYVQAGATIKEHRNSSYSQRPNLYISPKETHVTELFQFLVPLVICNYIHKYDYASSPCPFV